MSCGIIYNILNYFIIKKRVIKQYFTDCNIREVIERMEEFAKNKLVLIYDIDEYVQERKNKKRELWVTLARLVACIRVYEVFVMGFIDDIRIRLLIMDYTLNSNGNRLPLHLGNLLIRYITIGISFSHAIFGNEQAIANNQDIFSYQISYNQISAEFKPLQKILFLSQNNVFNTL